MVRPTKGNYKQTNLNLDPSETELFKKYFCTEDKTISEFIREYIEQENRRIESEKKETPSPKGALNMYISNDKRVARKSTLDEYFGRGFMDYENWQLRQKIFNELTDKQRTDIAIALNRTAKAWHSLQITEEYEKKKMSSMQ